MSDNLRDRLQSLVAASEQMLRVVAQDPKVDVADTVYALATAVIAARDIPPDPAPAAGAVAAGAWVVRELHGHPVSIGADEHEAWARCESLTGLFVHQLKAQGYIVAALTPPLDVTGPVGVDQYTADVLKECRADYIDARNTEDAGILSALIARCVPVDGGAQG